MGIRLGIVVSMGTRRLTGIAVLAFLTTAMASACGTETSVQGTDRTAEERTAEIFAGWADFASTLSFSDAVVVLADALPTSDPRDPAVASDGVLVGTVTDSARGDAWGQADEASGSERLRVDWSSEDADWRTARLTVEVEHLWSATLPEGPESIELEVRIAGSLSPDEFVTGLAELGNIVAVLDVRPVGEEPPARFGVLRSSTALGQVGPDGTFSFPAMLEEAPTFMGSLDSVADIEQAMK